MTQKSNIDSIEEAQKEMRDNYINGATGVLVSGFIWLTTAFVLYNLSTKQAIWTLLIGGAFIHPISTIINKMLGAKASHSKDNSLGSFALEGTFFMLMTIPIAYGLSLLRAEWFFQGMLLIIGGRYLTFHTLFGNRLFWILGGVLGISAYLLFSLKAQSFVTVLIGGSIELLFGIFLFVTAHAGRKESSTN